LLVLKTSEKLFISEHIMKSALLTLVAVVMWQRGEAATTPGRYSFYRDAAPDSRIPNERHSGSSKLNDAAHCGSGSGSATLLS
jgi:hypothetical protein